jgi:hypothetical protein
MSRRRRGHPLDSLLEPWGRRRRELLGITDAITAASCLGPSGSTLGALLDERVAAGSGSGLGRHFPEVYTGRLLAVNRAWKSATEAERLAIDVWYVWPGKIEPKRELLGWSEQRFRETLASARGHIGGWLAAHEQDDENEVSAVA